MKISALLSGVVDRVQFRFRANDWLADAASVVAQVREGDPHAQFLDAAFPDHILPWLAADIAVGYVADDTIKRQFVSRFRARGGSQPLLDVQSRKQQSGFKPGISLWIYVHRLDDVAAILRSWSGNNPCFLTRAAKLDAETLARELKLTDWELIRFSSAKSSDTGIIALVPPEAAANRTSSLATEPSGKSSPDAGIKERICYLSPSKHDTRALTLSVREVTTDNGYSAEGDAAYSWIWTGPAPLTRFALGRLPISARKVQISFAPTPYHRDLRSNLAIQLNGQTVAFEFDQRHDLAAVATVPLASHNDSDCVIGIVCRSCHSVDGSDRTIRICIDGIGVSS